MKINDKIKLTLTNETGRRLDTVATVTEFRNGNPYVKVYSDKFTNPPQLDLISEKIDSDGDSHQYQGEIGGAVMIPSFLWSE